MAEFKFEVWPSEFLKITQHFAANPQNYAQFGLPGHEGVDIRAPSGSKIFCVAPGEVFRVEEDPEGHNYGIHVRVLHEDGYKTIYAHLEEAMVKEGQKVQSGTVLGLADNTGNSFGSHLHLTLKKTGAKFEEWPYNIIDPTPFLLPLLGWQEPAGPYVEGWVLSNAIFVRGRLAQIPHGGATLYMSSDEKITIPSGTIVGILKVQEAFTQIRVARAALGLEDTDPPRPDPEPPPIVATVEGWAYRYFLSLFGNRATVGKHGVSLRAEPDRVSANIGIIRAGSSVSIIGTVKGRYLPIKVRRNDFFEPVTLPDPPPDAGQIPPESGYLGWVKTQDLNPLNGGYAMVAAVGTSLYNKPSSESQNIGLVKAFATISIAGPAVEIYTPILAREEDVLNAADPMPDVEHPAPGDDTGTATKPADLPAPAQDTTAGWAFSSSLTVKGNEATTRQHGINLRAEPRRDAEKIGFVPPGTTIIVTGPREGEYTPVRVREDILVVSFGTDDDTPDSPNMAMGRIGLHASADPEISEEEHEEFAKLRPGIIKFLSFHNAEDIRRLAEAHPEATFIVRAFLSFGGRKISPDQFLKDTIGDVRRALDQLQGRKVVVELHNEPNTVFEGLNASWNDGPSFEQWWLQLLKDYRKALPGVRFIYPGLSPGTSVTGVKMDHIRFLETSRAAVEAADGIGLHLYWSNYYPMKQALGVLDDYISRFRNHSIWITEASHNQGVVKPEQLANEYLTFWKEVQYRPLVEGITFFVASGSDPKFQDQVWLGKGIAGLIGKR